MTRLVSAGIGAAAFALIVLCAPCVAAQRVVTYSVATRGDVAGDIAAFVAVAREAYDDPRGWSLGGEVRFEQVAGGGDLTLWLASADAMTSFSEGCSPRWSCRVGRDVVVNDARFRSGSPFWSGSIAQYRLMLINHETGHWLGFDHSACPGAGEDAPVMMQQSKGVGACANNPWPLADERRLAAAVLGVAAPDTGMRADPPWGRAFTPLR